MKEKIKQLLGLFGAFAVVGGVQAAYTLFKSVGFTSKWLDALLGVTVGGQE